MNIPNSPSREQRRSARPVVVAVGVISVVAFTVGSVLVRRREWTCTHRYWADGSRNTKAYVPAWLIGGGIVLGVVIAVIGVVSFTRTRRPSALVMGALGLVPLIVAVAVVLFVPYHSWAYDCSSA